MRWPAPAMDGDAPRKRPRLALHPHRKRAFFRELAALLQEEPPPLRTLRDAFPVAVAANCREQLRIGSSASDDTDSSFECVDFGPLPSSGRSGVGNDNSRVTLPSQSSRNESLQDSQFFLPDATSSSANSNVGLPQDRHQRLDLQTHPNSTQETPAQQHSELPSTTTLVNHKALANHPSRCQWVELADYFDCDRMCELSPCWLRSGENDASCQLHGDSEIKRPMLLFCLQVLDEIVEWLQLQSQQRWRVQACKLARRVLTGMWEADVLNAVVSEPDIVLHGSVERITRVPGVALDVWRLLAQYWDRYKQNYVHHQELCFPTSNQGNSTGSTASKWSQAQDLRHIYGMKPSQALRIVEQKATADIDACHLSHKQLEVATQGLSSAVQLHVGMDYLQSQMALGSTTQGGYDAVQPVRRPTLSQKSWKTAFNAIAIHLQRWDSSVQVLPCGSFSRGAAFGSVVDVLVAVPAGDDLSEGEKEADGVSQTAGSGLRQVVNVLGAANVLGQNVMRYLSGNRGVCVVPFKSGVILLDLKVYGAPKSWFALVFFTGPESFVATVFSKLLGQSVRELSDTSFASIYASVETLLGTEALHLVKSERDVFDLAGQEYLPPVDRL